VRALALALAVAALVGDTPGPVVAGAVVAALLVMHRHRDNLSRLVAGTERRIGMRL
jgi:glycerol-3-phosphate acyltransferase PlsY